MAEIIDEPIDGGVFEKDGRCDPNAIPVIDLICQLRQADGIEAQGMDLLIRIYFRHIDPDRI